MDNIIYSIAIDGPSGSGKSTLAKRLSKELNVAYLDTGAMYRSVGLFCKMNNINVSDEKEVSTNIDKINIEIIWSDNGQTTILNGEDVSLKIRQEDIGQMASKVAEYKDVRAMLVKLQQTFAVSNSIVMDGRDIGTYVLPNATIKFYVDASPETRANRRFKELQEKGSNEDYDTVLKDIIERDYRDKNREIAPLVLAKDAELIDTSSMTFEEVFYSVLERINKVVGL